MPVAIKRVVSPASETLAIQAPWLNLVAHLDPRFGGISAMLPSFCHAVAEAGRYRTAIGAFCAPDETFQLGQSVPVQQFPEGMGSWLRKSELRDQLRAAIESSAGVHIHGLWQEHGAFGSAMARAAGKPYVVAAHGMLDRWALRNKRWKKVLYTALMEKRNLSRASCLHALTGAEADDYAQMGLKNPIAIIPNGVAIPAVAEAEDFLRAFPHLRGKRLVLFLARIHFKKGLDLLCRAWAKAGRSEDAHLVLAGPDFEGTQSQIEAMIAERGIGSSVTFTGMLTGKQKWGALAAADIFTLPSYSEGLSVSVLEAMGMGLPVIVTRQCNVPEVGTQNCGWMIEPDLAALTDAIEQWRTSSSASLRQLGASGRRVTLDRYSWSTVGSQMTAVYDWLLGGTVPSAVDLRVR